MRHCVRKLLRLAALAGVSAVALAAAALAAQYTMTVNKDRDRKSTRLNSSHRL